jgi:hypothetical protein
MQRGARAAIAEIDRRSYFDQLLNFGRITFGCGGVQTTIHREL